MKTTLQPRNARGATLPFLAACQPQRVLRISGLPIIVWSTPRQLWTFVAAIVCASALFCFASTHAVTESRNAIHGVAEECAPSIVAAQQVRSALADLDANLENLLLSEPDSKEAATTRKAADARRQEIAATLVSAAQNITFGDYERVPIITMVGGFAAYESLMAKARALEEKGDASGALAANREAIQCMDKSIIPAADALDKANAGVLERTYARQKFAARSAIAILILGGIVTIGLLAAAQIYLLRKTHRLLNPALFCATLIAMFQLGNSARQNIQAASLLRVAVDDAFASVHFLSKARALAYGANGEESRFLFDREKARDYEKAFFEDAGKIARIPSDWSAETIANTARSAAADGKVAGNLPSGFTGLLADELKNITFPGEREAAAAALQAFGAYLSVDKDIRAHEKAGRHPAAVKLCLSYEKGGSKLVFDDFDRALGDVLQINQTAFEKAKSDSLRVLGGGEAGIAVTTLMIIAGTIAGFRPRIREFQA